MQVRSTLAGHSSIYILKRNTEQERKALAGTLPMLIFTGNMPSFKASAVELIDDGNAVCAVWYHGDND